MYDECVIKQGGSITCPVCHTQVDWFYSLRPVMLPHGTEYLSEKSGSVSGIKPITDPFSKEVRFIMTCKICHTDMETDTMRLIDKSNYMNHHI